MKKSKRLLFISAISFLSALSSSMKASGGEATEFELYIINRGMEVLLTITNLKPDSSVLDLKKEIETQSGLDVAGQFLLFRNPSTKRTAILKKEEKLNELGIENESSICLDVKSEFENPFPLKKKEEDNPSLPGNPSDQGAFWIPDNVSEDNSVSSQSSSQKNLLLQSAGVGVLVGSTLLAISYATYYFVYKEEVKQLREEEEEVALPA